MHSRFLMIYLRLRWIESNLELFFICSSKCVQDQAELASNSSAVVGLISEAFLFWRESFLNHEVDSIRAWYLAI